MIDVLQRYYVLLCESIRIFIVLFALALLILFVFLIVALLVYYKLECDKAF
jgi:uncharacterized SAM-binding protein YcdF (DUF218 family)